MIRQTRETRVEVAWNPADAGPADVDTGIPFFDHMLREWAFHGGFGLTLKARGDLAIDAHHCVEDAAIALGDAVGEALGDRAGLARFGCAYVPLEESLARAVVDLARRPFCAFRGPGLPAMVGALPGDMVPHFFRSFAMSARLTLHLDLLQGENGHHMVESAFKAFGRALGQAIRRTGDGAASTKGVL
jgi:imidazoleglycerol phosphate dehydratase HisB